MKAPRFSLRRCVCCSVLVTVLVPLFSEAVYASTFRRPEESLLTTAENARFMMDVPISAVVGYFISGILSILGVIFLILIVYGGFEWLTSAGDEKKVATALGTIQQSAIGLVIVLGAYIITTFITNAVVTASNVRL